MDQGWIKSGHLQGDVLEPFSGSGKANRGLALGERRRGVGAHTGSFPVFNCEPDRERPGAG